MKKLVYWIIDYFYLLHGKLLMLFHNNPPQHYLDSKKEKVPVILIPGIANKWGFLKHLGDRISAKGHPVYIVDKLKFNFFDIPTSAKIIREIIDKNNLEKAIIVGHSKGGLIGKYFLIHENQDNRINGLIAIGAPFSGSRLTNFTLHKSFRELSPQSKTIQKMKSNITANSKIISIMPEFDTRVWSDKGSYLEGALNIKTPIKGHHKIVFDKDVIKKIVELISKLN